MPLVATHYLADIAQSDRAPANTPGHLYRVLWALVPNPFELSPIVQVSADTLAAIMCCARRSISPAVTELEAQGVVEVTDRHNGTPMSFKLHRPPTNATEIHNPFSRRDLVVSLGVRVEAVA